MRAAPTTAVATTRIRATVTYRDDYRYRQNSNAKSAAIIGGGAAAGAVIGGLTGGGKGAAIGAAVGVIGGLIVDQTTHDNNRYRR